MKIKVSGVENEVFLKRMFYLAYLKSKVVGMGVMQARDGATEDDIWQNILGHGDYPSRIPSGNGIHADYVFGRMMKLSCSIKDGLIVMRDDPFNIEYQSFARVYATLRALIDVTEKSLNCAIEILEN